MLGAFCGDIVGSRFEFNPFKSVDFELVTDESHPTDDSVATASVGDALLHGLPIGPTLASWVCRFPDAGYGLDFHAWARNPPPRIPYGSWGNGAPMRASPAGWLSESLADAARLGALTAAPTHDHHQGIRAAKAVAVAVRMALEGWTKEEIGAVLSDRFGYDLSRTPDDIRPGYRFEVAAHKSLPEAFCCLLAASSFEETVRLCVSLGGDADTQAAIAGSVAEPLFGIDPGLARQCIAKLPKAILDIRSEFDARVAGKRFPKTDPGLVERDHCPPEEGNGSISDLVALDKLEQDFADFLSAPPAAKQVRGQADARAPGFLSRAAEFFRSLR